MKHLRFYRERKNLSQKELADIVGVRENSVWRWENEKSIPNVELLQKLANVLEVSAQELINGSEEKSVIEVSLKFTSNLDMKNEVIDMAGTKGFALTMSDDGFLGIAGAAKIETREQLEAAFSVIKQRLEEGFAFQVSRGISREV